MYQGEDASEFNPGRHITPDGKLAKALVDTKDGKPFLCESFALLIKV